MKLTFGLIGRSPIISKGFLHIIEECFQDAYIRECVELQDLYDDNLAQAPYVIILIVDEGDIAKLLTRITKCKVMFPKSRLIMYNTRKHQTSPSMYFQSGIDGYLEEKCSSRELITCIENVLSGKRFLSNDILVDMLMYQPTSLSKISKDVRVKRLSPRESEIASLYLGGNSTSEIAQLLNLKPSTVSTIKKNILTKMQVSNIIQLVHLVR